MLAMLKLVGLLALSAQALSPRCVTTVARLRGGGDDDALFGGDHPGRAADDELPALGGRPPLRGVRSDIVGLLCVLVGVLGFGVSIEPKRKLPHTATDACVALGGCACRVRAHQETRDPPICLFLARRRSTRSAQAKKRSPPA